MEKDYKAMLDRAYKDLPEQTSFVDRFAVPRANIALQFDGKLSWRIPHQLLLPFHPLGIRIS